MRWTASGVVCAVMVVVAATAATASPARQLGDAYRAFERGDYDKALALADKIDTGKLRNPDYALFVAAQSAYLLGDHDKALARFGKLAAMSGSRFSARAKWRRADCLWQLDQHREARAAYEPLAAGDGDGGDADAALARFRIAEAAAIAGDRKAAIAGFLRFRLRHPAHPLEERAARRLVELAGADATKLSAANRLERAKRLQAGKDWHEAVAELEQIPDSAGAAMRRQRDYWIGETLFKMRRQYERAGELLLGLYKEMGSNAAQALFHGARALSRADRDLEAMKWYDKVVAEYPGSEWAAEASYLSGWLYFNLGKYREALPRLNKTTVQFAKSKWAREAQWFHAFSLYMLGEDAKALAEFEVIARRGGKLDGAKGRYWRGRTLARMGRVKEALPIWEGILADHPFSWYALLARARLRENGVELGPFGRRPAAGTSAPAIAQKLDPAMAGDPMIQRIDELIEAGLDAEAGIELRRGEKGVLKRFPRPAAMALLMDRYRKASNFNRPYELAEVHGGGRALDAEPEGPARVWWEHAYPRAYGDLVDKWQKVGNNPAHYLHAIMRKESGYDPHVHSFADAIGLMQMIPPTTRQVARSLGIAYTDDLLFDPSLNIKTGSWYIGKLLAKFKGQVPLGAGAFNSGPAPIMRWLDQFGDRPTDEFIELCVYMPTREYMKKVTENYARYVYLYDKVVYEPPAKLDKAYVKDELTY